jgi:predicted alpha/beta-fold hydrolase
MPLLPNTYSPSILLRQGDLHTLLPHYLGAQTVTPSRSLWLKLPDNDEIEIFCYCSSPSPTRLIVISHGLEGSVRSPYLAEAIHRFTRAGFAVVAWNMRGCGGRYNNSLHWYHSGYVGDLLAVVDWTRKEEEFRGLPLHLLGFSVGGNITLRALALSNIVLSCCVTAACVSVPIDLEGSALSLAKPRNRRYMKYLLAPLKERMRVKATQFPGMVDLSGLDQITTFYEFDSRYTAPLHGFSSVNEYWRSQSALFLLHTIKVKTLLLSAQDDPFLSKSCFPFELTSSSKYLYGEFPKHGGHVGFLNSPFNRSRWMSERVLNFFTAE